MLRDIINIGPITVRSFGLMIVIGILVFMRFVRAHPSFKKLKLEGRFIDIMLIGITAALAGGRLLHAFTEPELFESPWRLIAFWEGGLALLGGVLGVLIAIPWYLRKQKIPVIPFLDLIALYTPLLQGISRIGCFLAGCCWGCPTNMPWAITYTGTNTEAPINVAIHPTQLYSSLWLLASFLLMYCFLQYRLRKPGQITCVYLMLMSIERFCVDFFRDDRLYNVAGDMLSVHQYIAAYIFIIAVIIFMHISRPKKAVH